ncbi:50S ribosomal protein L10 [Candidatus Tachikawaea gelatinosa]|uniref:Large ribosomal subunit protein uL10 n=1 Tax=Candidatus Tachikawaea gelatinosa TaxID=1410383 RepID=A0A090ARY9_9ENTR|nr:50S ribosomal protein L10 [Candidatus Tachikawaea gelatinosa]BAP58605.1 50S ribosomal protein L10 [Candidatus Tachikawaea gelatinosa]
MALNLHDKQKIVVEVSKVAKKALSAIIADLRNINVEKINELRKISRKSNVYIRVVRNTLLNRIIIGTQFESLKSKLFGPTIIAYSMEHPGSAARIFKEFAKNNTQFQIKAACFEGKLITAENIDELAMLPTYEEVLIKFLFIIQEISIGKFVRTLSAIRDIKK